MRRHILWGMMVGLAAAACGDDGGSEAMTDAMVADPDAEPCAPAGIVYLNQNAGTYTAGPNNSATNESSIIQGEVTIEAFTSPVWDEVVTCIREGMSPFNVSVVETDPGDVDHAEVVFTSATSGAVVGQDGIGSIAPFACTPFDRPIVFVFGATLGNDAQAICKSAMSSWGSGAASLDHAYLCEDFMTELEGCGPKSWVDQDIPCGEFEARACACGNATQNSYQTLLSRFGPSCL